MTPLPFFRKPRRKVTRVFLHCSASDRPADDDWRVIDRWHRERGFDGIGYHYFVKKDGTVQPGRDLERLPAAQQGHNTGTIAICLHGLAEDKFTKAQFDSLRSLCGSIARAIPGVTFHGHCEISPKSCPVFDYKKVLRLGIDGRISME